MRKYHSDNLVVHPGLAADPDVIVEVTPAQAGWDTINFQVRRLGPGSSWSGLTRQNELVIVPLSGSLEAESGIERWTGIGGRESVFSDLPHALYLSRFTSFKLTAMTECQFALAWTPASQDHPPRLVTPEDVSIEIRGGDHATRQINNILPPGFPCERLVVVEVYTPGGNWSSYPPHKHDLHITSPDGNMVEADLDEIYYYKIDRPEGYALQRIYTDPESPLHRAGYPIDAAVVARDNDVVLIPEGYHPVASPVGYMTYYLNVLAGSAQSLASSDDPQYSWVKDTYQSRDPRLPVYPTKHS
jgi:5-deoxy-glucuronate isomerase